MCTIFLQAAKSEEVVEPTLVIEMLNKRDKEKMLYSEDIARVEVGDTISWVPTSKGHNVQFVSVPEGVYVYICTPHASMGMIGLVIVGDSLENLDSVKKHKLMGKSKKKFKKLLKNI